MGVGSLREAISIADSGDTIRFSSIIDELPIVLSGHQLFLDKNLTIIGNHSSKTKIDGNSESRIFEISIGTTINLFGISIRNGFSLSTGGGIYNEGTLSITHCKILENAVYSTYAFGGGIYNKGNLILFNSAILSNRVSGSLGSGGGLYNKGHIALINSTINDNKVLASLSGRGGGICDESDLKNTIFSCTISGNYARATTSLYPTMGGGIYNTGDITLTNSVISGNVVESFSYFSQGGGVFNEGLLKGVNCTISGNASRTSSNIIHTSGRGICNKDDVGHLSLTSTIVALNAVIGFAVLLDGTDISGSINIIENSLIGIGNDMLVPSIGSLIGTATLPIDPHFILKVPPTTFSPSIEGNLRLALGSPAINAGLSDTLGLSLGENDLDGLPRINEDSIDIGAYEFQCVNRLIYSAKDSTICEENLPLIWGNVTFYSPGTLRDTAQTINFCDSILIYNLSVYPPILGELIGTSNLCQGEPLSELTIRGTGGKAPYEFKYGLSKYPLLPDEELGLLFSDVYTNGENSICIPLATNKFTKNIYMQGGVKFNSDVLVYQESKPGAIDILVNSNNASIGELRLLWDTDLGVTPVTVPDGEVLFELCFDVIGNGGERSEIQIIHIPFLPIEIVNENYEAVDYYLREGSVTIGDHPNIKTVSTRSEGEISIAQKTDSTGIYTYSLISVSDSNGCSQAQSGTAELVVHPLLTASI